MSPGSEGAAILARVAEADAGAWIVAVDEDGRFLYVSESYCAAIGRTPSELLGRNLALVAPPDVVRERLEVGRRIADGGKPVVVFEFVFGRRFRSIVVPLPRTTEGKLAWVVTLRPALAPTPGDGQGGDGSAVVLHVPIWGLFDGLTDRELEVLRLLAMEMSNEAIAAKLSRTKRAVEWHVRGLMQKLGTDSRVSLFRAGFEAGLHCVGDEDWREILKNRRALRPKGRKR